MAQSQTSNENVFLQRDAQGDGEEFDGTMSTRLPLESHGQRHPRGGRG